MDLLIKKDEYSSSGVSALQRLLLVKEIQTIMQKLAHLRVVSNAYCTFYESISGSRVYEVHPFACSSLLFIPQLLLLMLKKTALSGIPKKGTKRHSTFRLNRAA